MTTQYTLTKQLHDLIPQLNEKYGVDIYIQNSFYNIKNILQSHEILQSQAFQIRQILVELKEVLGENPEYVEYEKNYQNVIEDWGNYDDVYSEGRSHGETKSSQAEALCQKWLDGLDPLIDREPETVLSELLEILKKLI